ARDGLGRNLEWLRQNPRAKVELEGHCDSRGTIEYNLALGAKRARTVKDYLVTQGIAADRISTISYGKELPLCHEENETCWTRNRRVHAVVLGPCGDASLARASRCCPRSPGVRRGRTSCSRRGRCAASSRRTAGRSSRCSGSSNGCAPTSRRAA